MATAKQPAQSVELNEKLAHSGFRFTPQRQGVYDVLHGERDHPTAEEVFIRTKKRMPEISLATVYNCLDALVTCGLVKQVTLERGASHYCPNMHEHGHFHCEECGGITDIELAGRDSVVPLPRGYKMTRVDMSVHGFCPDCATKKKA